MNIQKDIPLAEKTTFKIGGPARFYSEPEIEEEIKELLVWAKEKDLPVFILGKGSNVVISDTGFKGLVINLTSGFNKITWQEPRAICQAGAMLPLLVSQAIARGLGGIEKLGGIPGSVGGAIVMNAGADGQEVGSVVESFEYFDPQDQILKTLSGDQMNFSYRSSALKGKNVCVVAVTFALEPSTPSALKEVHLQGLERRRQKLPLDLPNCGSIFKNPSGFSAGALIEQCGLKGYESGGVKVSEKHANVFVNVGNGHAADVKKLFGYVGEKVFEKFKIRLEPEILFIGDFSGM